MAFPPDFCFPDQTAGVYKSDDDGATWTAVNSGLVVSGSIKILLSVSKADGAVYAMVVNTSGGLGGIFKGVLTINPDKTQSFTWKQMDTPSPDIFPGKQGTNQGAIVAHPTLANVVFVSGDRQDNPTGFPNDNGCTNFTGNIFRGDASAEAGSQWTNAVCNGANGSSPHADSRAFAFSVDGTGAAILLHGCDGGLFELADPDTAPDGSGGGRTWLSFNGDIRPTEIHSIAFDPLSHILISGNQDTGTSYQVSVNSQTWTDIALGDGAVVAVDADQTAHEGTSLRYESFIQMQSFRRHTFNSSNVEDTSKRASVGLNIVSGTGSGSTLLQADNTRQFYNPWVLNNINPARMLIGTSSLYESSNMGDSLNNLGSLGAAVSSLSYGSRLLNASTGALDPFPDAFYVAAGTTIFHRVSSGNAPTMINSPGSAIVALVMNPMD